MTAPPPDPAEALIETETRLDPARPTAAAGVEVLGYGEVSVALRLAALPGLVCKRMSGFRDVSAVARYQQLVAEYLDALGTAGVRTVATTVVPVRLPDRRPVVYLLQPELPAASLGHRRLATGDDATLDHDVARVLAYVLRLHRVSSSGPEELAVDGQLSNWAFLPEADREPLLVDVGTPFMRRGGQHLFDPEIFLSAVPPVLRAYYRHRHMIEAYLDDYFEPRLVAVDLLGNFHKEGRPDRIPVALARVNAWLGEHAGELGRPRAVTVDEVSSYYRQDARLLALFLRLRRLDRFVRATVLRGRYDFVLPGQVRR